MRIGNVVGLAQELLDQLRTALTDRHGAVSAVARMGVGAEDHSAAAGIHFAHIAVDDGLMRGDKFTAVALRGRQTEHMVVLVDRAADGAQGIVAVGQHIRQRKFLQSRGAGGLNDTDIGNIVRCHGIKSDFQRAHIAGGVVRGKNAVGNRLFLSVLAGQLALRGGNEPAVTVEDTVIHNSDHRSTSVFTYYISPVRKSQKLYRSKCCGIGKTVV